MTGPARWLALALIAPFLVSMAAAPQVASDVFELPILSQFDMLLDEPRGLIFISELAGPKVIAVDLEGQVVGEVGGLTRAAGLALSPDAQSLWVALPTVHAVARIDIATMTETERIALPSDVCPGYLVATASVLATAHSCRYYGNGLSGLDGLGVIDLSNGNAWQSIEYSEAENPQVAGSPGLPGTVVFTERSGWGLDYYDVSSGAPVLIAGEMAWGASAPHILDSGAGMYAYAGTGVVGYYPFPDLVRESLYWIEDVGQFAVSADGSQLVAKAARSVIVFDIDKEEIIDTYEVHRDEETVRVTIGTAGEYVIYTTRDRGEPVKLWIHHRVSEHECFGKRATIVGTKGRDYIEAAMPGDVIVTLAGDDHISRVSDDVTICAGPGDDRVDAPGPATRVSGGPGTDSVNYNNSYVNSGVVIDLAAEWYPGVGFADLVSIEMVVGSRHDDVLLGDDRRNLIYGGGGDDFISGRGGNDYLSGGNANDQLYGGPGDDNMVGASGHDELRGGDGDDRLNGGGDHDTLLGGDGNDRLVGGAGGDTLDGRDGDDDLRGGSGNDLLLGSYGNDALAGNTGDDTLAGERGNDTLTGGIGTDTASFAFAPAGVLASIRDGFARGEGRDSLDSIEWLVGSERTDHLIGSSGPNLIEARGGDDSIEALAGDDWIHAGDGTDIIRAGSGDDLCVAGETNSSCETEQAESPPRDLVPRDDLPRRFTLPWGPQ